MLFLLLLANTIALSLVWEQPDCAASMECRESKSLYAYLPYYSVQMSQLEGTGAELARLDFGPLGVMVIRDDGDNDHFVNTLDDADNGESLRNMIMDRRAELRDDDQLVDELETLADKLAQDPDDSTGSSGSSFERTGPFSCTNCHKTWPQKRNQTPDRAGTNLCPECHDDN